MPDRRNASTYNFPYCEAKVTHISTRKMKISNENIPLKQLKELNVCQMTGEEKKWFHVSFPGLRMEPHFRMRQEWFGMRMEWFGMRMEWFGMRSVWFGMRL